MFTDRLRRLLKILLDPLFKFKGLCIKRNGLSLSPLSVNDELRQTDNSQNLIIKSEDSLSELSHITNLSPGDMLLTGSPGGCALSVPPAPMVKLMGLLPERLKWQAFIKRQSANPKYLKAGDQIVASIKSSDGEVNLGTQINRVCGL